MMMASDSVEVLLVGGVAWEASGWAWGAPGWAWGASGWAWALMKCKIDPGAGRAFSGLGASRAMSAGYVDRCPTALRLFLLIVVQPSLWDLSVAVVGVGWVGVSGCGI